MLCSLEVRSTKWKKKTFWLLWNQKCVLQMVLGENVNIILEQSRKLLLASLFAYWKIKWEKLFDYLRCPMGDICTMRVWMCMCSCYSTFYSAIQNADSLARLQSNLAAALEQHFVARSVHLDPLTLLTSSVEFRTSASAMADWRCCQIARRLCGHLSACVCMCTWWRRE